jgi:crotonobetaine/carnitine-CoA ligase
MDIDALLADGLTVKDLLTRRAADSATRPFIRFGQQVSTYGQVHERAVAAASTLADLAVDHQDLVALMLPNSVEYVELFFALAYRGSGVVLVNTAFRGYMLEYVLNDAGCRTLVADREYLPEILESQHLLDKLEVLLVAGPSVDVSDWDERFEKVRVRSLGQLLEQGSTTAHEARVSHRDLHCVVYSSGTTGPSKGIMISNAHSLVKAAEVLRICGYTEDDTLYSPLPLFYSMGLLRGVLSVALVRSSIALRDKFSVTAFWTDVQFHRATVAHCVFSMPRMLAQAPPSPAERDHRLRCMFNAQHNPELEARFGVQMIESYGLTEAGNAIYNRFDEPVVAGSCGRESDEWEVLLADPHAAEVPVGDTGEILIRPRYPDRIMLGYLNKPEVTTAAFRDLWFHTGDLARRDERGFFFYQGRNKDVIRRRGQNISGWEVEQILLTHPEVADVAALAEPSEVGEDDVRVVLVAINPARPIDLAEVAAFCERRMPAFMVPRFYEEITELPRTPSGRVEKYKLEGTLGSSYHDRGDGRR